MIDDKTKVIIYLALSLALTGCFLAALNAL